MSDVIREPWARRGEVWNRAERAADKAQELDHPEMLALIATQQQEIQALMGVHAHERIRLALLLRDETPQQEKETS